MSVVAEIELKQKVDGKATSTQTAAR